MLYNIQDLQISKDPEVQIMNIEFEPKALVELHQKDMLIGIKLSVNKDYGLFRRGLGLFQVLDKTELWAVDYQGN